MTTLARQGSSYAKPYSLDRDSQTRTQLEAALDAALGRGFTRGGHVTKTAALAIEIDADFAVFAEGVSYERLTAQAYSGFGTGTVYVWGPRALIWPRQAGHFHLVENATSGAGTITAKVTGGTGEPLPTSGFRFVFTGADAVVLDPANLGAAVAGHTHVAADVSDFDAQVATDTADMVKVDGSRAFTADQSLGGFKLTDLDTPTLADDAATKDYVDTAVAGTGGALASEVVGAPNITVGAEASNTIVVSVQFRDVDGNNISARMSCLAWLADSAHAAPSSTIPDGGWDALTAGYTVSTNEATGAGGNVKELASGPTGSIGIDISHAAGARTWILHIRMGNQVYTGTITFA
jgi:hypothetical protein